MIFGSMFSDAGYAEEIFPLPGHLKVSPLFSFSLSASASLIVPELRAAYADLDFRLSQSFLEGIP